MLGARHELSRPQALPVSRSPFTIPPPPELSLTLPPHSSAWALPPSRRPAPAPTFPLDTPQEWKNYLSSLSCSQPRGSDVLGIPVGDGQRDNAGMEPFRVIIMVLSNRQDPCPLCVSTWPLHPWPWLRPPLLEQGGGPRSHPKESKIKLSFQPSQLPVLGLPISPNPSGSWPQVDHEERQGGSGTKAVLRTDRDECPLPKTTADTVIAAAFVLAELAV